MESDAFRLRQRSTFLALPPEIRNDICERLLKSRRPIKVVKGQSEPKTRILLDICRQLKNEFSALYYSTNIFACQCTESDLDRQLDSTSSLISWMKRIGPSSRAMLREVQICLVSKRTFTKHDFFAFLRDQNVRLALEAGWLPLTVLRMRMEEQWLNQTELSEIIVLEEEAEEVLALDRTGSSLAKGPDLRTWKRDIWDPVIDKYSKPGKRPLSEFVCPANWRYYAKQEDPLSFSEQTSEKGIETPAENDAEEEAETGCIFGSVKVWAAKLRKVRKCRVVVARIRRRRSQKGV